MKADIINTFLSAAKEVLEMETGLCGVRGEISLASSKWTSQEITVILSITGDIKGTLLIGFSGDTAMQLTGLMLGEKVKKVDDMVVSGVAEMGNVIAGRALAKIEVMGYTADVCPPMVIQGQGASISTLERSRIQIPLNSEVGLIELSVAIEN